MDVAAQEPQRLCQVALMSHRLGWVVAGSEQRGQTQDPLDEGKEEHHLNADRVCVHLSLIQSSTTNQLVIYFKLDAFNVNTPTAT